MTNEELLDIVKMRLYGRTLDEIGEKYGMTYSGIKRAVNYIIRIFKVDNRKAWGRVSAKIIYPMIRERMDERRWTVSELADKAGLSLQAVRSILYGRTIRPQITSKELIAKALDMSVDEAFRKEECNDA